MPVQTNGISFVPVFNVENPESRNFLYWELHKFWTEENNFQQAVRIGNMKGVRYGVNSNMEVYNLENDISETHDVADEYPELVKKMKDIVKNERTFNEHFPYGGYMKNK